VALACALVACSGGSGARTAGTTRAPGATSTTTASPVSTTAPGSAPCGRGGTPPARYDHVVWIWMENHTRASVIGNSAAPYENELARACATANDYADVGNPSLPNYLAATSGSTHGIGDDADPAAHPLTVDNLFRQVRARGGIARSYEESMPANCTLSSRGSYAVRHNPAAYYVGGADRAACIADDVPLGTIDAGALHDDLAAVTFPTFAFITPDLCNDTHDCSVSTGDAWLSRWIPAILGSPAATRGSLAVFVVWDEPTPLPFLAVAPTVPQGAVVGDRVDHYALLRTTEEMLGISDFIGQAGSAPSLRGTLGL
jgi:hypothetical protein